MKENGFILKDSKKKKNQRKKLVQKERKIGKKKERKIERKKERTQGRKIGIQLRLCAAINSFKQLFSFGTTF